MTNQQSSAKAAIKYIRTLFLLLFFSPSLAKADVSLFLQEALGVSGEASSAGHVSIYFSNICAESPLQVRACRPEEKGIVIASYPKFGADQPYHWIVIPLTPFLYGVTDERDIPLYVNGEIRTLMRETYRRNFLSSFISDKAALAYPAGSWREMIGSTYNRDIYSFTLKTTPEEDAAMIKKLNRAANENNFSTLYNNCADFARDIINTYFPHATRRDALNDFTMTSPKAVARSLTRYGAKHPERLFYITKYSQFAGPIRRSLDNRNYSEMAFTSKKYLIPQILFQRYLLAFFATSYFAFGRFNVHQNYVKYGTPQIGELNFERFGRKDLSSSAGRTGSAGNAGGGNGGGTVLDNPGQPGGDTISNGKLTTLREIESRIETERARIFGTKELWKNYQTAFAPMLQKAIDDGLFADKKEVKTFFKDLELQSEPAFDERGALYLKVSAYGDDQTLGLTRDNILDPQSNPQLAYKLLLAKVNATLNARQKNREELEVFKANWELLTQLATRSAESFKPLSSRPKRFLTNPEKTTFKQKVKKVFVIITH